MPQAFPDGLAIGPAILQCISSCNFPQNLRQKGWLGGALLVQRFEFDPTVLLLTPRFEFTSVIHSFIAWAYFFHHIQVPFLPKSLLPRRTQNGDLHGVLRQPPQTRHRGVRAAATVSTSGHPKATFPFSLDRQTDKFQKRCNF